MHSHFVNLINHTISDINKAYHPNSRHPYLSVNLQNAISVQGLYDTGANISCLSKKVFDAIPPQLCLPQSAGALKACHRASSQALHIARIHDFYLQIGNCIIRHQIHLIQNPHEDIIMGVYFIHAHQLTYNLENQDFSWGPPSHWTTGQAKATQNCQ
jgi:hypothetical protein